MDSVFAWAVLAAMLVAASAITLWVAGAVYYDAGGASRWGLATAAGWAVGVATLFAVWRPLWQPFAALLGVTALFLVWWLRLKPSHDRDWDPTVAVLPRAVRDGDVVTIENVRNFEYRSLTDFTPRYETRAYHLSNLKGLDIIFFNWGVALMSHPVLVFDFGPDGRVCLSIEVRYRKGQAYSVPRSFYRQQELIFLAMDERDAVLRRTKYGPPQETHLYRFHAGAEEVRDAFLDYVGAINGLAAAPRWYHGLTANCTTAYYRLPNSRCRLDWRVVANGRLDRALYEDGRLDRSLPFPDLKRLAYLNDAANAAPEAGFGDFIRRELEARRRDR
ncbi:MAG: DUF4105 domain-containing protein [Gemmataceae bacterium]